MKHKGHRTTENSEAFPAAIKAPAQTAKAARAGFKAFCERRGIEPAGSWKARKIWSGAQQAERRKFCECGQPAEVRKANAWICKRCASIERFGIQFDRQPRRANGAGVRVPA